MNALTTATDNYVLGGSVGIFVVALVLVMMTWSFASWGFTRRRREPPGVRLSDLFFVLVVPCLDEELVIASTLERLLALPERNFAILVVDDASEDSTASIVQRYLSDRVLLLRRRLPHAQQGKGEALNAAFRFVTTHPAFARRDPNRVVVGIFDADGRVDDNMLANVAPYFTDSRTGAVQVGVRMYNANDNLLTKMQDFEFVTFTEVFQQARDKRGTAGLGGNGQFSRLSALQSLGASPWTPCLTEDLDLGIRMNTEGWRTRYCSRTFVSQQAVTTVRRLVRQRTRWFQGHLQCWRLIPRLLTTPHLRHHAANSLLFVLLVPATILLMSLPVLVFATTFSVAFIESPSDTGSLLVDHYGRLLLLGYALTFGMSFPFAVAYRRVNTHTRRTRAIVLSHLYCLYGYMWFFAGWAAVARQLRHRSAWAKTARNAVIEAPERVAG